MYLWKVRRQAGKDLENSIKSTLHNSKLDCIKKIVLRDFTSKGKPSFYVVDSTFVLLPI